MKETLPPSDLAELRAETLRFLYERARLPHQLSAIHAGVRRAGQDVDKDTVASALDYLVSASLATCQPGTLGGGRDACAWKITHTGTNLHESQF